jgi:hypothetical protein
MRHLTLIACTLISALAVGCIAAANNAAAVPNSSSTPININSVSPTDKPAASPQQPSNDDEDDADNPAVIVIRDYYAAINAHDYRKAYRLWDHDGEASKQTFEGFSGGFADTADTRVEIGTPSEPEGAAGSQYITLPVEVRSKLKDGTEQRFKGEYVLRRSMVEGAEHRGEWRIYSADIRRK